MNRLPCIPPPLWRVNLQPLGPWFGSDPGWRRPFEAVALRRHAGRLTVTEARRGLTYAHTGVHVPGRPDRVPLRVELWADPGETFGLPPEDMPWVFADAGPSPHRYPNGALCLFFPGDPPWRRWLSRRDGLDGLLEIACQHLAAEHLWRAMGAQNGGQWVLNEAPHGFADKDAA